MAEKRKSTLLRIGHCQAECAAGDVAANVKKVMDGLRWARAHRIDVMSFPESFLTGYFDSEKRARRHSFAIDGREIRGLLKRTAGFTTTFMVGFNEKRGGELYNTVLVSRRGRLLGTYSKACPCFAYFTPGRQFPVFACKGVKFGVIICADGGYVEPARILALKGAQIIFAPHYNYVGKNWVLRHYAMVRSDHVARAVENGVFFLRGNNVSLKPDAGIANRDGVGYGDSYLLDPFGRTVVQSTNHVECFLEAEIDVAGHEYLRRRSIKSGQGLREAYLAALAGSPAVKDFFC